MHFFYRNPHPPIFLVRKVYPFASGRGVALNIHHCKVVYALLLNLLTERISIILNRMVNRIAMLILTETNMRSTMHLVDRIIDHIIGSTNFHSFIYVLILLEYRPKALLCLNIHFSTYYLLIK